MTKFSLLTAISVFCSTLAFADIAHIDLSKISTDQTCKKHFDFIENNKAYYKTWINEWKYDKTKAELIGGLQEAYKTFSQLKKQDHEVQLLLGDISHYLYNMDAKDSFVQAVKHYEAAIKSDPKDIRGYWFLGSHYGLANLPLKAIEQFTLAKKLPAGKYEGHFWDDYAYATTLAGMPSTTLYALNKSEAALGRLSEFGLGFKQDLDKKFTKLDPSLSYKFKEIWDAFKDNQYRFIARPLGIKLSVDSTWKIQIPDYSQKRAAIVLSPPALTGKDGKTIGYTVFMIMKVAEEGETFASFMDKMSAKYSQKKKVELSTGFGQLTGYEVQDQQIYADKGGAHVHIMGMERNQPEAPGMLLEQPISFSSKDTSPGQLVYYRANKVKTRFEGKIFYMFLLDTCEDIHSESFANFKVYLDKQVVVE